LFGSYEALEGGMTDDALVDFTGGVGYRVDLTKKRDLPRDLFARMQMHYRMSTLMGCSINVSEVFCISASAIAFQIGVCLRNDLYCVGWGVKLSLSVSVSLSLSCPNWLLWPFTLGNGLLFAVGVITTVYFIEHNLAPEKQAKRSH